MLVEKLKVRHYKGITGEHVRLGQAHFETHETSETDSHLNFWDIRSAELGVNKIVESKLVFKQDFLRFNKCSLSVAVAETPWVHTNEVVASFCKLLCKEPIPCAVVSISIIEMNHSLSGASKCWISKVGDLDTLALPLHHHLNGIDFGKLHSLVVYILLLKFFFLQSQLLPDECSIRVAVLSDSLPLPHRLDDDRALLFVRVLSLHVFQSLVVLLCSLTVWV